MISNFVRKYKNISESVKCSLYYIVCNIFQKGIAFLTVPIFTRMMSTDEYGQFTVFQSWTQVILILTSWNLAYGVLNKALTKFEKHDEYVSSIQGFYSAITILFFILYFLLKPLTGNFLNIPPYIELLFVIETLCTPALALYTVKARFELHYKIPVLVTMILTVANPTIGIILVNRMTQKGIARILGYLIAQIIVCAPVYLINLLKGKKFFEKEFWKYTFEFSLPLIPYFLSTIILNQSDKIMISRLCGDSFAGIYGIAFSLAMLLRIINESVDASFVPWMYKKIKANELSQIKSLSSSIIVGITALNMIVILFTPELVKIIGSEKYSAAIGIMPVLTISVCLMFQTAFFNHIEMYFEKNKVIMAASIVLSGLNIILNYIFIKAYGYQAAAYTTLFCYLIMLIWHITYTFVALPDMRGVVSVRTIVLSDIILIVYAGLISALYSFVFIRVALLVVLLLLGCTRYKDIVGRFKNEDQD